MADLFDYLKWRGDLDMVRVPFSEVDCLILSELSYIDFTADEPRPLGELCLAVLAQLDEGDRAANRKKMLHLEKDERLMRELAASPRFRELTIGACVSRFDAAEEEQFAAMTVFLPDGTACVVYRGTDWSLVGWKEDVNMAYCDALPAQKSALAYLRVVGKRYQCPLRVMGHSKGGNLAIFASAFAGDDITARILDVTSLDGPGFSERVISSPEYKAIADRVRTVLPRSSIVGTLFSRIGRFAIVENNASPVMQHIPYTWEVMGGSFVTAAERDGTSQLVESALNDWISSLEPAERKKFIDTAWSVLAGTDITELGDLLDGKHAFAIIKNYNAMDEESKKLISQTLARLQSSAKASLGELIAQYRNRK